MIVVDTNIVAMLFLGKDEERGATAELAGAEVEWLAPHFWTSEWLSVLRQHMRSRGLSHQGACAAFYEATNLVRSVPHEPVPERVLELSRISGCSTYDCEFVALAMDVGAPLVTLDRQVTRAFPDLVMDPAAAVRAAGGR